MTNQPETLNEKDLIVRKDGLIYKKHARVPFTGVVDRSGDSKTKTYSLDMRMHYEKGARTVVEWFYDTGQTYQIIRYKNGEPHGRLLKFSKNGQLMRRENYKKGKAEGLSEDFYKDGHLESKENYKDDELHGLYEMFHENGQLRSKQNYKGGKLDGPYEEYFENGQLKEKTNYKTDAWGGEVRIGEHKYFHKNGKLELIERFKRNGKRVGLVKGFYENGKPAFTEFFKNHSKRGDAVQHGEWVSYSQEGHICIRNKYMNGEIRSYEIFDATGKLEQKINATKYTSRLALGRDFYETLHIYDSNNALDYDSRQLNNDIVFKHAKRELLHALRESGEYRDHGLIEWTDLIPQRIRNDEDIAWAINPRAPHYTWYPALIEYLGDKLKSNEDFIEGYYDSIRKTLIREPDFFIKENNSPIKWNNSDWPDQNEAVRFLSIILELQAMDKRLINRPFKSWIKKTFKKHVSKEFFESLNDQET